MPEQTNSPSMFSDGSGSPRTVHRTLRVRLQGSDNRTDFRIGPDSRPRNSGMACPVDICETGLLCHVKTSFHETPGSSGVILQDEIRAKGQKTDRQGRIHAGDELSEWPDLSFIDLRYHKNPILPEFIPGILCHIPGVSYPLWLEPLSGY